MVSEKTPELSVVVPAYHESGGIAAFMENLFGVLRGDGAPFEVIVIDDGSSDATWARLKEESARRPELRGYRFTRNFGKEAAILAGLRHARGRAVVVIDGDGQHPPSLIPEMAALWRSGKAQIVSAKKVDRRDGRAGVRLGSRLFNWLAWKLTGFDFEGASDFRLLDRLVVDTLLNFPERVRFFRGMTAWTGFPTASVEFKPHPRLAGDSQWSTAELTRLAITAITAFSAKPLALVFELGLLGMAAAVVLLLQALYSWCVGIAITGWTSLTVVILFFGSANLLGIGVLGAYLAQLFEEIKARPEFLVVESFGDL